MKKKNTISKLKILELVKASLKSMTQWKTLLLIILIDFLFIMSLGASTSIIQLKLLDKLQVVMQMAGESTGGLLNVYNETAEVSTAMMGLTQSEAFQAEMNSILFWLLILILMSYVMWVIFQGISWYLAHKISTEKRQGFWRFYRNFALQSIPFYILTVVWIFVSVKLLLSTKMSMVPFMSETTMNMIFAILVIITWYFGTLCYTITTKYAYRNFKQSFIFGVKRFLQVIQSVLVILVSFVIIDMILRAGFLADHPFILILLGAILFLPAVIFARVLLFKTTQEYWIGGKD